MKPALAFPLSDPHGTMFPHLQAILPDLKQHFERAYLSPTLATQQQTKHMHQWQADNLFTIFPVAREMQIGEHFAYLYKRAADMAPTEQILHLCYPDRVSFALEGDYRETFLADIDAVSVADVPLIFQRSTTGKRTRKIIVSWKRS